MVDTLVLGTNVFGRVSSSLTCPTYNPLLVAEVRNYLDIIEFIRRDKTRHNCGKELIDCYPIRRIIWRDSSTG